MEEITINGTKYNLVPQETQEEKVSYKRPRAEEGNCYYYILLDAIKYSTNSDNWNYEIWNYYLTEQEAQKARDKQLATVRVNDAIDELNEGWAPDWRDFRELKYYIGYNLQDKRFGTGSWYYYLKPHTINSMKSKEIAEQIIKEHEEDLKLIFNIV